MNFRHCMSNDECMDERPLVGVLNGLFLVAVLLGYPSVHFPTRRAAIALVWGIDKDFSWFVHCGVATVLVGMPLLLAINLPDVSMAFSWTGAIASPLLVFVLPSLYFYLVSSRADPPPSACKRYSSLAIAGLGLVFMAISVAVKIEKM